MPRILELAVDPAWLAPAQDGRPRFLAAVLAALADRHKADAQVSLLEPSAVHLSTVGMGLAGVVAVILAEIGLSAWEAADRKDRHVVSVALRDGWFSSIEFSVKREEASNLRVVITEPAVLLGRRPIPMGKALAIITAFCIVGFALISGVGSRDLGKGLFMFVFLTVVWGIFYGVYRLARAVWTRFFGSRAAVAEPAVPAAYDIGDDETLLRGLLSRAPTS